ncbi:MAG: hypothetical protein N3G76_02850 [Candidatus Micrarchaeota archaeon]|nr:hypothetical protein [Candidatus Micrarchaeota archaeon]
MMRLIILKRLSEIKSNLEELLPQLDPGSKVYKDAKASLERINATLANAKIHELPREVRIDTSQLKMKGSKLSGKVLMSDNTKVYYLTVDNNEIKDMKVFDGGIKKMEYLEATVFKNG